MKKLLFVFTLGLFWIASIAFAYSVAGGTFTPTKAEVANLKKVVAAMKKKEKAKPGYAARYVGELQKALTTLPTTTSISSVLGNTQVTQKTVKTVKKQETKTEPKKTTKSSTSGTTTSRVYITGPKGGCYYINSNGNKTYVDRSMC